MNGILIPTISLQNQTIKVHPPPGLDTFQQSTQIVPANLEENQYDLGPSTDATNSSSTQLLNRATIFHKVVLLNAIF